MNDSNIMQSFDIVGDGELVLNLSNINYVCACTAHTARRIAGKLSSITTPSGFQYAAHAIRDYFAPELRAMHKKYAARNGTDGLAAYAKTADRAPIDAIKFAKEIATIKVPTTRGYSLVERNLDTLTQCLNLTSTEQKFLQLAYCVSRDIGRGVRGTDDGSGDRVLAETLGQIRFDTDAEKYRVIAEVLGEPEDAVQALFTPPCRLLSSRCVSADYFHIARDLYLTFVVTEELLTLLDTPHRCVSVMRESWLQSEHDWKLDCDRDIAPTVLKRELSDQAIWVCYWQSIRGLPLTAGNIKTIIHWFTDLQIHRAALLPLSHQLSFIEIRDAIKSAALECGEAAQPFTEIAILRALYAATVLPKTSVE